MEPLIALVDGHLAWLARRLSLLGLRMTQMRVILAAAMSNANTAVTGAYYRRDLTAATGAHSAPEDWQASYSSARASQGRCGAAACWPSGQDRW